jgi:hypothetical protein
VLIHAHCQMLVAKMQFVQLITTLVFVHVKLEPQEIHYWAVFNFNTVAQTINVPLEQNVAMEFATQFAQAQEIVSLIRCVFKVFANQHAKAIQHVLTSSFAKTTFVFKNQSALMMKIVRLENNVQLIQMEDQNAKMFAVEDSCVVETQTALQEITTLNVSAKVDSMLMERYAERLNVKQTMSVQMINVVKTTCARLSASWVHLAEKMLCAQLQTTNKSVNVNPVFQEIL